MAAEPTTSPTLERPRRFSIPLPRPLWMFLVPAGLIVLFVGLRFGPAFYRQQSAINQIQRIGGSVWIEPLEVPYILFWRRDHRLRLTLFGTTTDVNLNRSPECSDATLECLQSLPDVRSLD